ncbi:hypothetical protein D3C78_1017960 [compost metagenome]
MIGACAHSLTLVLKLSGHSLPLLSLRLDAISRSRALCIRCGSFASTASKLMKPIQTKLYIYISLLRQYIRLAKKRCQLTGNPGCSMLHCLHDHGTKSWMQPEACDM